MHFIFIGNVFVHPYQNNLCLTPLTHLLQYTVFMFTAYYTHKNLKWISHCTSLLHQNQILLFFFNVFVYSCRSQILKIKHWNIWCLTIIECKLQKTTKLININFFQNKEILNIRKRTHPNWSSWITSTLQHIKATELVNRTLFV